MVCENNIGDMGWIQVHALSILFGSYIIEKRGDDMESINAESTQLILNYLDKISQQLGATGERLWPILIKQQYVNAVEPFVLLAITGLLLFFSFRYVGSNWNGIHKQNAENAWIIVLIVLGIATTISLCMCLDGICHFINPEYYALKLLMGMVPR